MCKLIKYILFGAVLLIVTLHAIIPHSNSGKLTEKEYLQFHVKSISLIGIIRGVFYENDHENLDNLIFTELEIVKEIDAKLMYSRVFNFDRITSKMGEIVSKKIVVRNTFNFKRLHFVKLNWLRGPPL